MAVLSMLEQAYPEDPTFRFLVPSDRSVLASLKEKQLHSYAAWFLGHTPLLTPEFGRARITTAFANMLGVSLVPFDAYIP